MLIEQREFDLAERELAPVLGLQPPPAIALVQLGRIKSLKGDRPGARKTLLEAARLEPDSFDPLSELVSLDVADGAAGAGRQRLQAYLAAHPKDARAMVSLAGMHLAAGERQSGETLLRRAIEHDASSMAAFSLLGSLYLSEGKGAQALTEFQAIVKQRPSNLGAQIMVGIALESLGRTEEAKTQYEAHHRGQAQRGRGGQQPGLDLHADGRATWTWRCNWRRRPSACCPTAPRWTTHSGTCTSARACRRWPFGPFARRRRNSAGNPVVRWHLAQALAGTGDKAGAIAEIEAALRLNPKFDGESDARAKLLELRSS